MASNSKAVLAGLLAVLACLRCAPIPQAPTRARRAEPSDGLQRAEQDDSRPAPGARSRPAEPPDAAPGPVADQTYPADATGPQRSSLAAIAVDDISPEVDPAWSVTRSEVLAGAEDEGQRVVQILGDANGRAHLLVSRDALLNEHLLYLREDGARWTEELTLEGRLVLRDGAVALRREIRGRLAELRAYGALGFGTAVVERGTGALREVPPFVVRTGTVDHEFHSEERSWRLDFDRRELVVLRPPGGAPRVLEGVPFLAGIDPRNQPVVATQDEAGRSAPYRLEGERFASAPVCSAQATTRSLATTEACRSFPCVVETEECALQSASFGREGELYILRHVATVRSRLTRRRIPEQRHPCPPGYRGNCGTPAQDVIDVEPISREQRQVIERIDGTRRTRVASYRGSRSDLLHLDARGNIHVGVTQSLGASLRRNRLVYLRFSPAAGLSPPRREAEVRPVRRPARIDSARDEWDLVARGWEILGRPVFEGMIRTGPGGGHVYRRLSRPSSFRLRGSARALCGIGGFHIDVATVTPEGVRYDASEFALAADRAVLRWGRARPGGDRREVQTVWSDRGPYDTWHDLEWAIAGRQLRVSIGGEERARHTLAGELENISVLLYEAPFGTAGAAVQMGTVPPCSNPAAGTGIAWRRLEAEP